LKRRFISKLILISLVCLVEGFGFASSSVAASDTMNANFDGAGSGIKMVMYVIFILILVIGLFFLIIKVVAQKNRLLRSGRSIKTIGGVSVGQNKSIQVVEIGHTLFVVGVGENVQLVAKIEDSEEIEYILEHLHIRGNKDFPTFQSFAKWFKGMRGQSHIEEEELSPSFQQVFHEKMERISNRKQRVDELLHNDDDDDADRLNDK
jgi:flagellar protein FliO/FliZ